MRYWIRFKHWLILRLGGRLAETTPQECMILLLRDYVPSDVYRESMRAFRKVQTDASFKSYHGSNLGRNIKRDECAEWTKLYLKDAGHSWKDSDVNLACELIYHLSKRF